MMTETDHCLYFVWENYCITNITFLSISNKSTPSQKRKRNSCKYLVYLMFKQLRHGWLTISFSNQVHRGYNRNEMPPKQTKDAVGQ